MRKLSWWFRPHGLIYGNFEDLRDTGCPSVQFWRVFRKMLRTMQSVEGEDCTVEFQGERWQLRLRRSGKKHSTILDWISVAEEEETLDTLKKLAKKRIRPCWIAIYEFRADVILHIGPCSHNGLCGEKKTRYMVEIYRPYRVRR